MYGNTLDGLHRTTDQVRQLLSTINGISRPAVEAQSTEPTIQIQVDLAKAQKYGIKPGDVRRASATFFAGLPVGSLYEEQKIFDVVVWGTPAVRHTPSNVTDLMLDVPGGGHVRLGDVASVQIGPYPTVIKHDNVSRSLDVTASVRGRDLATVVDEVRARVHAMAMPLEFHAEVHSDTLQKQGLFWRVGGAVLAAALAIFLLLQAAFSSWRLAALIFLVLPVSTVGGVLTASFVGGVRSLGALMGLLAVFGVAARNAVLVVKELGRDTPADAESVDRIVRDRAGSIVLSALTMVAAVLPLLFFGRVAGTEALLPVRRRRDRWSRHVDAGRAAGRARAVPAVLAGPFHAAPSPAGARGRRFAYRREGCDAALDWLAGHNRRSRRHRPHRLRLEGIE